MLLGCLAAMWWLDAWRRVRQQEKQMAPILRCTTCKPRLNYPMNREKFSRCLRCNSPTIYVRSGIPMDNHAIHEVHYAAHCERELAAELDAMTIEVA